MNININKNIFRVGEIFFKRSLISFTLAILAYFILSFAIIFRKSLRIFFAYSPLIIFNLLAISLILSILDLKKKNESKGYSIMALVLSSAYFLFIIGSIIIFK